MFSVVENDKLPMYKHLCLIGKGVDSVQVRGQDYTYTVQVYVYLEIT